MKSRKVKRAAKSKVYMSKKKLKGNIALKDSSDSEAEVDNDSLLYDAKQDEDEDTSDDDFTKHDNERSSEEEVLPITDDESDEDEKEAGEDSENDEDEGLPSKEAWGSKKSTYYSADFVDEDRGRTYREEDAEKARLEEEEALAMQRSVSSFAANIVNTDLLQLQAQSVPLKEESDEEVKLESLDEKQKLKYLKKKSPELLGYIEEFKDKIAEGERLSPLVELIKNKNVKNVNFANYIKVKYQVLVNYCMNISFYMVLRTKGPVISNHPIFQRINSYKNILNRLNSVSDNVNRDIGVLLEKIANGEKTLLECNNEEPNESSLDSSMENNIEDESSDSAVEKVQSKKKKKQVETAAEREIFTLYKDSKPKLPDVSALDNQMDVEENNTDGTATTAEKRNITYEMAKNKGQIAKRKKALRNPRVHHRLKYRKAKIRRKGQVRDVIREVRRYDGEPTGISTHVVKSIKFK